MTTPVDILLAVAEIDGQLGIVGDKLRILLPANCAPELKDAIRQQKPAMLDLLRLDFLVVRSSVINSFVLWTPDEATKQSLIAAGARRTNIYTLAELDLLVDGRTSAAELPLIHAAKQRFSGKVTNL